MKTVAWVLTTGWFLVSCGLIYARKQTPAALPTALTLEDCIRLAEQAPSTARQAGQRAEIARYGVSHARAGFLPRFEYRNSFTYNSPLPRINGTSSFVALNGVRDYTSEFATAMELDTSGRLRAELACARADRGAANATLGLARRDLKRAVTTAHYRLLLARHLVQTAGDKVARGARFRAAHPFAGAEWRSGAGGSGKVPRKSCPRGVKNKPEAVVQLVSKTLDFRASAR